MRGGLALVVLLAACSSAQAAVVSERPDKVTVTIYHEGTVDTASLSQRNAGDNGDGLALITETRSIDLPAGPAKIQFRGVAGTMVPQTADVSGLPDATLERNFDYDLLSPGALLAKSVGQTVHLVRRTGRRGGTEVEKSARVLSGPDGVMLEVDGKFEALNCSGLPERLVFDRVPDGLIDTPTLSIRTNAARAGRYTVTLRYIATGLNWSADYVARIGADDKTLDLSGWITLANFADTGFAHAPVEVIAGHVQTTGDDRPQEARAVPRNDSCWPMDISWARRLAVPMLGFAAPPPAPMMMMAPRAELDTITVSAARKEIEARNLGDYKLYPLPEPTDVAARQTKQVQFLDRTALPFERVYGYRMLAVPSQTGAEQVLASSILLRLQNTARGGLGKPLPAGGISTMAIAPDGEPFLAGRDTIKDTAAGSPLEIAMGQTSAVRAQTQVIEATSSERRGIKHRSGTLEVTLTNDTARPVTFEWRQTMDVAGATLVSESRRHGTRNGDLLWSLTLNPGEPAVLRYTIDAPG